jgi:Fibrobacter succinogenes major domain (Fib_succ_major).
MSCCDDIFIQEEKNMKKLLLFTIILIITVFRSLLHAQTVTITFFGRDTNNQNVQFNSVVVNNLTAGWQETLHYPDNTLTMQVSTGIDDFTGNGGLSLSQNSPNPFHSTTDVHLHIAEAGTVTLEITDISGRIIETYQEPTLPTGTHHFSVALATTGTYFMTARQNGKTSSIKMVCQGGNSNLIEYQGCVEETTGHSSTPKLHTTQPFHIGDQLEYIGYANIIGIEMESSHIFDAPSTSHSAFLEFAYATGNYDTLPCPSSPTVTDQDGNVYNTVQIGNQCWMKENLRVTHYSNGEAIPMGDSTSLTLPYRYCPDNNPANVASFGYLYNWPAVMHGAPCSSDNPSGVQGICPKGWHVPSNAEFGQLIYYAGSMSTYQCNNNSFFTAKAFAAQTGWQSYYDQCSPGCNPSTNNATGFSAKAAGHYSNLGTTNHYFYAFGGVATFWTTTDGGCNDRIYMRHIYHYGKHWQEAIQDKHCGLSVRCVRN